MKHNVFRRHSRETNKKHVFLQKHGFRTNRRLSYDARRASCKNTVRVQCVFSYANALFVRRTCVSDRTPSLSLDSTFLYEPLVLQPTHVLRPPHGPRALHSSCKLRNAHVHLWKRIVVRGHCTGTMLVLISCKRLAAPIGAS